MPWAVPNPKHLRRDTLNCVQATIKIKTKSRRCSSQMPYKCKSRARARHKKSQNQNGFMRALGWCNYRKFAGDRIETNVYGVLEVCRIWNIRFGVARGLRRRSLWFRFGRFLFAIRIVRLCIIKWTIVEGCQNMCECWESILPFGNGRNSTAGALSLRWCSWNPVWKKRQSNPFLVSAKNRFISVQIEFTTIGAGQTHRRRRRLVFFARHSR